MTEHSIPMVARKLIVNSTKQEALLEENGKVIRSYKISTAVNGLGCKLGSLCTPTGVLRVAKKIGDGLPIGSVLRERKPTGELWTLDVTNPLSSSTEDLVLTRILWLEGSEDANSNTLDRFIYIHGTNQENLLGQRASHGCIRLSNTDVVELFELLSEGAEVFVT